MPLELSQNIFKCSGEKWHIADPYSRYASFDYCYNYFQDFRERGKLAELSTEENLQQSCLQLGFYLASWGMMRGSTFLLQHSVKQLEPVIQLVSRTPETFWSIDLQQYSADTISNLLEMRQEIAEAVSNKRIATDTLTTKIMLGIFGNIPAFDSYFCRAFGVNSLNRKALQSIAEYYSTNQADFEETTLYTLDFLTGQPTQRRYPNAKRLDMQFFELGQQGHQAPKAR